MALPKYHGTYWSVGEMNQLDRLIKSGATLKAAAKHLHRSQGACASVLLNMRKEEMRRSGSPEDTIISWKKKLKEQMEEK